MTSSTKYTNSSLKKEGLIPFREGAKLHDYGINSLNLREVNYEVKAQYKYEVKAKEKTELTTEESKVVSKNDVLVARKSCDYNTDSCLDTSNLITTLLNNDDVDDDISIVFYNQSHHDFGMKMTSFFNKAKDFKIINNMNKWDLLSAIDYMSAEHDRSDLEMISKAVTDRINSIFGAEVISSPSDMTGYDGRTVSAQAIIERISQQMMNVLLRKQGANANAIAQPKMILITGRERDDSYTPAVLTPCPATQAALDRVAELKRRYTPEQVVAMRKLRAEVEEMLIELRKIDKDDRENISLVLKRYGINPFQGKKVDGDPIIFVKSKKNGYEKYLSVLFKAEVRFFNKSLTDAIRNNTTGQSSSDPFLTEDQKTEMYAAGILGTERDMKIAHLNLTSRQENRYRTSMYRKK